MNSLSPPPESTTSSMASLISRAPPDMEPEHETDPGEGGRGRASTLRGPHPHPHPDSLSSGGGISVVAPTESTAASVPPPRPTPTTATTGGQHRAGSALLGLRQYERGVLGWLERAALHTVPAFFAINMGTGIVSILLHNFPYPARWLEYLGTIVFVLNVVIFVVLCAFTLARYVCWKGLFNVVLKHNVASMFWGCFPMGFTTIINMICFVCVPAWGKAWAYIALGFWWACVVVSVGVKLGVLCVLFTRQQQTEKTLAPTWLLPIVTTVVAAASGAVVAQALMPYNPNLARGTIIASFCVWGTGVPPAMMVITLVIYRTAIHGPPEGAALASSFLPLGPCGQGSFGIISMGVVIRKLAYEYNTPMIPHLTDVESMRRIADAMYAGGLVVGLVLWGLALVWYSLAVFMFVDGWRKDWSVLGPGKFAVGLWGLTFPIGVYATSTIALGQNFESTAFKVIGAFLAVQVILHWLFVGISTLWKTLDGTLFAAPELAGLDEDHAAVRRRRSPSPRRVGRRWSTNEKVNVEAHRSPV